MTSVALPYPLTDTVKISKYLAVQVSVIAKFDPVVTNVVQKVDRMSMIGQTLEFGQAGDMQEIECRKKKKEKKETHKYIPSFV